MPERSISQRDIDEIEIESDEEDDELEQGVGLPVNRRVDASPSTRRKTMPAVMGVAAAVTLPPPMAQLIGSVVVKENALAAVLAPMSRSSTTIMMMPMLMLMMLMLTMAAAMRMTLKCWISECHP